MDFKFYDKATWRNLAEKHRCEIRRYTESFRARRRARKSHPVEDFLFVYYRYSSAKIEQWHPGIGVRLELAKTDQKHFPQKHFHPSFYACCGEGSQDLFCNPRLMSDKLWRSLAWIVQLLHRTESNRPNFSCLGLHEWAMVYQGQEVRHEETTQFRLSQREIDRLVESRPLTCTHYDAFRFYAIDAKPLNRTQPTLEDRPTQEQPACIHANMDLYKWAFRSMPWIGSDLLVQCFGLAKQAREIDMRASPYDLSPYGSYEPIKIETSEGRSEYERLQRIVAQRASVLRRKLIEKLELILSAARPQQLSDNS